MLMHRFRFEHQEVMIEAVALGAAPPGCAVVIGFSGPDGKVHHVRLDLSIPNAVLVAAHLSERQLLVAAERQFRAQDLGRRVMVSGSGLLELPFDPELLQDPETNTPSDQK